MLQVVVLVMVKMEIVILVMLVAVLLHIIKQGDLFYWGHGYCLKQNTVHGGHGNLSHDYSTSC